MSARSSTRHPDRGNASGRTLAEHEAIYALADREPFVRGTGRTLTARTSQ